MVGFLGGVGVPRGVGTEELRKKDGFTALTEALRSHSFQKKEAEAKVLYKHGHNKKSLRSRQPQEPIVDYILVGNAEEA